ncbi:penicillin-binding protein activator [Thiohalobacter sp.]|uniref:penicillin-binding protein activator n=1 Tax=Thiohalobacter sp. TaxID=2025948 RepID=UPI002632996C|nr:penicillin-binding protein activator [Thiohalobacter sp.]
MSRTLHLSEYNTGKLPGTQANVTHSIAHRMPARRPTAFLLLVMALWLNACTAPAPRPPAAVVAAPPATLAEAEALVAAGDLEAAAARYEAAADTARGAQAAARYRRAAELYQRLDEPGRALAALERALAAAPDLSLRLQAARMALAAREPERVSELLAIDTTNLPPERAIEVHRLRANAYSARGNHLEAAREHVWLDGLIRDPQQREANQQALWAALTRLSDAALIRLRSGPPDALSGWMELVQLGRHYRDDPAALQEALGEWRRRYPGHPASDALLAALGAQQLRVSRQPRHIAVLLPASGSLKSAGDAIRDGLVAAWFRAGQPGELRFFDTAGDADIAWNRYREAVDAGAEMIIGPLLKPAVRRLAQAGTLEVPVLALNRVDVDLPTPVGLFQFGLAPEDDATEVAVQARRLGFATALALVPEGEWGQRLLSAFAGEWEAGGGVLLEAQAYPAETRGLSGVIERLLNIDASQRRHQQLTRLLGQRLEFEPRRRKDADFAFMAAQPDQARLIKPLFRFHHAGELSLFATAHAYSGVASPQRDRDLDGLLFVDLPWVLETDADQARLKNEIIAQWPERGRRQQRLFALGVDAFDLTHVLDDLRSGLLAFESGATGRLELTAGNRIRRHLVAARFRRGTPEVIPETEFVQPTLGREAEADGNTVDATESPAGAGPGDGTAGTGSPETAGPAPAGTQLPVPGR